MKTIVIGMYIFFATAFYGVLPSELILHDMEYQDSSPTHFAAD